MSLSRRLLPAKLSAASLLIAVAAVCAMPSAASAAPKEIEGDVAVLQWLDKVTARVSTVEASVGESVHVGTLEILVRSCRYRPPEETPESAAFLDITENKPGAPTQEIFRGWMFASSPALSAMEHPIYDVWVLDCRSRDTTRAEQ